MRLRTWQELAAHSRRTDGTIEPFPDELPEGSACDFDALKGEFCSLRAGSLCSVDAWGVGDDGSFFFIEFKDQDGNKIAQLKKKAFDSLIIFWLTIGHQLSLDEIRKRSEFILVKPDAEGKSLESDKLAVMLNDLVNLHVPMPEGFQLEEMSATGMYKSARSITTSQFASFLKTTKLSYALEDNSDGSKKSERIESSSEKGWGGAQGISQNEISLNQILMDARCIMNGGESGEVFCDDGICAVDFKKMVSSFLTLRMMLPMDRTARQRGMLFPCNAYMLKDKRLVAYQAWNSKYPVGYLANMMFDSFLLWACVFHSDVSADTAMRNVSMCVVYDGDLTNWMCSSRERFVVDFFSFYKPWFDRQDVDEYGRQLRFGLQAFVENGFYRSISSVPSDQFADFLVAINVGCVGNCGER